MRYGLLGTLFSAMFSKTVYEYTARAVPQIDIRDFKRKHMAEYKAMVARTPSAGSMKDNMFAPVMYLSCYGFAYYNADPEHITMDVFDGMIDAICKSDTVNYPPAKASGLVTIRQCERHCCLLPLLQARLLMLHHGLVDSSPYTRDMLKCNCNGTLTSVSHACS